MKSLEVLRAGAHQTGDGAVLDVGADQLAAAAAAYDAALHEAPLASDRSRMIGRRSAG
jgi:hypothetical protein